ncbi:zinc ribbon domain-containing protein [Sphingomonas asaccharolytica]|uniref:zinc ribbon domain-containing protein n=1 Tax=Sphingomonas asaccharolytica TaxID=40681 RepID=UPI00082B1883|nr:zinc ribbon domain-containing protein [Sphingomonas asaccharolytica]
MSEDNLKRMCTHCDAALPEAAKFCPACGVATGDGSTTYEEAKAFVMNSASEAEKTARELMKNEDAQKIAGAAAVGAVAAIVLPISMVTGAVIGAGIMAYNRFAK